MTRRSFFAGVRAAAVVPMVAVAIQGSQSPKLVRVFDARKHHFCVPVIDGMVVPKVVKFSVFEDGICSAECLKLNAAGDPFPLGDQPAMTTIIGKGFAIPLRSPALYHTIAEQFPEMSLDRLK